ncbi:MAG: hypothetical protein ACR2HV_01780 [Acidimicrobiales bacterium]
MGSDLHDAKVIVGWVLGASVEPTAHADSPTGHDFDLYESGRRFGAMAVARSDRPPHPQSSGSTRRLSWDARGLGRSWMVRLVAAQRSGPDERMIVGLLAELERAGGTGFQRADQVRVAALRTAGVRLSPAERVLEDLAVFGVVGAESGPANGTVPTVVAKVTEGAFTAAEAVNEAVEDEAWRPGNRARLRRGADERHLFVWLDEANLVAHAAMDDDAPPAPPLLAPETTTLWVARRGAVDAELLTDRLWQTNGAGQWEALGPVMRRRLVSPASRR